PQNLRSEPRAMPLDLDLRPGGGERDCLELARGRNNLGRRWSITACQGGQSRPQFVNGALCCFLLVRRPRLQFRIEQGLLLLQEPDQLEGRLRSCFIRQLPHKSPLKGTCAVVSVA